VAWTTSADPEPPQATSKTSNGKQNIIDRWRIG
jgi:hypothetical protein